jgi:hypothetical protein
MTGLVDADPVPDAEWAAWAVNNSGDIVGGYGIWPSVAGSPSRRTADGVITTMHPLGANGGARLSTQMASKFVCHDRRPLHQPGARTC